MVEARFGDINVPGTELPLLRKAGATEGRSNGNRRQGHQDQSHGRADQSFERRAGNPAAQDEREAAENMTPLQLAEKFSSMSPDQMDAYFRTL